MFKKLALAACLLAAILAAKANDEQKVSSKVNKVIVFLNGAQVTRQAVVNISPGTSTLVFEGLSPDIDAQSIQVRAGGDFTIMSVKQELNFLNAQLKQKQVEDLQVQQKAVNDKIIVQNNLLAVYQQEEAMLEKNQVISGQNTNLDIVKLKQALDFQTDRLTQLKAKEVGVNAQIALLDKELKKYTAQIASLYAVNHKDATSNVLVTVSSKRASEAEFTLNYLVHNANWYPTYDIRAKNVNSPISITYKANVSQQSGEDWKNVRLTLSTGNPSVSGNKPELDPYYLSLNMQYTHPAETITKVTGVVRSSDDRQPLPGVNIRIEGTSIGTVTDANGNYILQVPAGNPVLAFSFIGYEAQKLTVTSPIMNVSLKTSDRQLNEVVVTGYSTQYKRDITGSVAAITDKNILATTTPLEVKSIENQTNIEFNIVAPYSVPSDGKQYLVDIGQMNVNTSYTYSVVPKLSTDVFLTAKLTDWSKYNLLSGEANLFFEDTFIGKSLIDTHNTTDTLNLSLGTDKSISVTRVLQKEVSQKQSLGANRKETRDWLISIKNRKNQPVDLLVEDQLPVSQNSAIEVEAQDVSGGKADPLTGKVLWQMNLKPDESKKLELKYQVRYPKNQAVIVQ